MCLQGSSRVCTLVSLKHNDEVIVCMHSCTAAPEDPERAARCRVHESTQHVPDVPAHGEGDGKVQARS